MVDRVSVIVLLVTIPILFGVVRLITNLTTAPKIVNPTLVHVPTKLPFELWNPTAVYADNGMIYIIGDKSWKQGSDPVSMLRFNIHTETVEYLGQLPDTNVRAATVYNPQDREIYYLRQGYGGVTKLILNETSHLVKTEAVGRLDTFWGIYESQAAWDPVGKKAYIHASDDRLWAFHPSNNIVTSVSDKFQDDFDGSALFYCGAEGNIYLFGTSWPPPGRQFTPTVLRYNPSSKALAVTDHVLARDVASTNVVGWDGDDGVLYIVTYEGLQVFSPKTKRSYIISMPDHYQRFFGSNLCTGIYVPGLKRFYIFNGPAPTYITYLQM